MVWDRCSGDVDVGNSPRRNCSQVTSCDRVVVGMVEGGKDEEYGVAADTLG